MPGVLFVEHSILPLAGSLAVTAVFNSCVKVYIIPLTYHNPSWSDSKPHTQCKHSVKNPGLMGCASPLNFAFTCRRLWWLGNLGCRLDMVGKQKPQLRNCFHQVSPWPCLLGIVFPLLIDVGGARQLWVVPSLGRRVWLFKKGNRKLETSLLAVFLYGLCLSFSSTMD